MTKNTASVSNEMPYFISEPKNDEKSLTLFGICGIIYYV